MKHKKLFKSFIGIVMAFSFCIPMNASADKVPSLEDIAKTNEVNASKYAASFVGAVYSNPDLQSGDVRRILDENDQLSGYCVDIVDDGTPNGYVVIKFSDNQPVVSEFCVEPNVKNPYDSILERMDVSVGTDVLYSFEPYDYQVYLPQENILVGYEGEAEKLSQSFADYKEQVRERNIEVSAALASRQTSSCTTEGLPSDGDARKAVNYSSLDGWSVISDSYTGTLKSRANLSNNSSGSFTFYSQNDITSGGRTYACSVTALCNMMKYLRDYRGFTKISSSLSTLYSKLWSLAGTSSSGSTSNGSEAPAAKSYLQDLGYSASYGKYLFDWYSDFTRDINANKPILMSYGADFGGSEGGHCVFVVGYVETSDYQYLRVADGWNRTPRYLNYNGYNYTRRDGWAFSVS